MLKRRIAIVFAFAAAIAGAAQAPDSGPQSGVVSIGVDLAKPVGAYKPIYAWFGYDESNYTTMKYGKQLLGELHDLSPVPVTIRAHHLLTSGNGVPELKWSSSNVFSLDANGKPVYDFTITDQTFDEYQKAGIRPMVELGFMPKDLAATVPGVTEYQLHYPKPTMGGASNNPPKDYKMWGELVALQGRWFSSSCSKGSSTEPWMWTVDNRFLGRGRHPGKPDSPQQDDGGCQAPMVRPGTGRPGPAAAHLLKTDLPRLSWQISKGRAKVGAHNSPNLTSTHPRRPMTWALGPVGDGTWN